MHFFITVLFLFSSFGSEIDFFHRKESLHHFTRIYPFISFPSSRLSLVDERQEKIKDFILNRLSIGGKGSLVFVSSDTRKGKPLVDYLASSLERRGHILLQTSASELVTNAHRFLSSQGLLATMLELSSQNPELVWVIRDIHHLKGLGKTTGSTFDFYNELKRAMFNGKLKVLGTTNSSYWEKDFRYHPAHEDKLEIYSEKRNSYRASSIAYSEPLTYSYYLKMNCRRLFF